LQLGTPEGLPSLPRHSGYPPNQLATTPATRAAIARVAPTRSNAAGDRELAHDPGLCRHEHHDRHDRQATTPLIAVQLERVPVESTVPVVTLAMPPPA
jgi:hypothetical protein